MVSLLTAARGVSTGTTCLLSVFPAVTLSLGNVGQTEPKVNAAGHVALPSARLCKCW